MLLLTAMNARDITRTRKQNTILDIYTSETSGVVDLAQLKNIIRRNTVKPLISNQTAWTVNQTVQPVVILQE